MDRGVYRGASLSARVLRGIVVFMEECPYLIADRKASGLSIRPRSTSVTTQRTSTRIRRNGDGTLSDPASRTTRYSVIEAAEMLGISRAMVYVLIEAGEIRSRKIGARRVITREALAEFLAEKQ
jgi:excisionase family DNA binding protein